MNELRLSPHNQPVVDNIFELPHLLYRLHDKWLQNLIIFTFVLRMHCIHSHRNTSAAELGPLKVGVLNKIDFLSPRVRVLTCVIFYKILIKTINYLLKH